MDGSRMTDLLTQEALDEGQSALDKLMKLNDRARRQACKAGRVDLRNTLAAVQSHLLMAYSVAGGIKENDFAPRSGDK